MEQHREEIRQLLDLINQAWSIGRPADLAQYFDEHMVMRGPAFEELSRGRAACVQSYVDFVKAAKIHELTLGEPAIDLHGETAVAAYTWQMTYELATGRYTESGHDLFVFSHASGHWQAVWRTMIVKPE